MSEIKQINTGVVEIIAVKVPEVAHEFTIIPLSSILFYSLPRNDDLNHIKLPKLKYEVLGLSTELTEEQCREVMVSDEDGANPDKPFETAKESFASLMQANGCYSVNPIPQPEYQTDERGNGGYCDSWVKEFEEAEANTGSYLILVKK